MKKKYSKPYQYEEYVASILPRARRTMASGALHGNFDVNSSPADTVGFMVDCKITDKKSFRVSNDDFKSVEKKCEIGQIPAMFILIQESQSYVVLKEEDFLGLLEGNEGSN